METWLDSPGDLLAILGILGGLCGALLWIVRGQVAQVQRELKKNGGSTLADTVHGIDDRLNTVLERQGQIAHSLEQLRTENDDVHRLLGAKVDRVSERLDHHAASPAHDRRKNPTEE